MAPKGDPNHQFDRRASDTNVAALKLQVMGLEGRMEKVEYELKSYGDDLRENTKITTRIHTLIEGTDASKGMRDKVTEMYDVVETAQAGFRILGKVGDFAERNGKRFFWLIAIAVAVAASIKSGKFELPLWPG